MPLKYKHNMNMADRLFRTAIGLVLIISGPVTEAVTTDTLSLVLMGLAGVTALLSAFFSYCFLYDVTGFDTTRSKDN